MHKLSPSDFAYLYEECKLCYCLKVKHGVYQPSMPMPGIFSAINTRLQGKLVGKNLKILSEELPDIEIINQEGWVESTTAPQTSVYIKGKYDLLGKDSNGEYALIDLKISQPADDKIEKYKTQLGAYKFALENSKTGNPIKIKKLALLIFYPDQVSFEKGITNFTFPPKWLDVPVDEPGFLEFIKSVDNLLAGPMPSESRECKWCRYRNIGTTFSQEEKSFKNDLPF
ncbi:PD-(D/E)XK nuclease family protein [Patescibacteria group bacterium]|nr:PD-(D/E)XK nuclease family protein [Patescibacteria group bacterium]